MNRIHQILLRSKKNIHQIVMRSVRTDCIFFLELQATNRRD